MENKEVKAENTAKPADPDDIYATLDWDTNPPINGFYEMMMGLTPSVGKNFGNWQGSITRNKWRGKDGSEKPCRKLPVSSHDRSETQPGGSRRTCRYRYPIGRVGTFLFPDIEAEKPKEEVVDLSPRAYDRTPEMHLREGSLVADRGRHNIGYLKRHHAIRGDIPAARPERIPEGKGVVVCVAA